ncbi:MAG: PorP/SprF family type IX secretion system membrane protein [Saprospiraceae bacterium]
MRDMRPTMKYLHVLLASLALLPAPMLRGQDLHYSQFYHNPMHLSPAAAGQFVGDMRAAVLNRSQWSSVPVDYRSFSGAFDLKLNDAKLIRYVRQSPKNNNSYRAPQSGRTSLSAGALIQRDQAGDGGLSWIQATLAIALAQQLGESYLSAGIGVGAVQRSVHPERLTFGNQWSGEIFDPGLPSKENIERSSGLSPTLSAGVHWRYQSPDTRTQTNFGAGLTHLNRPRISLIDEALPDHPDSRLPRRMAAYANAHLQLYTSLDLVTFGAWQQMSAAREIVAGGGLRQILNSAPGAYLALQATGALRLGDAFIPALQVEYNNWIFGLSYDLNTSDFNIATQRRGGLELAVVWRSIPVPPSKTYKVCPIF